MNRRTQIALLLTRAAVRNSLSGGVLAFAAFALALHAQSPAPAANSPAGVATAPAPGASARTYAFDQSQSLLRFQPSTSYGVGYAGDWSHSTVGPLATRPSFGSFSGGMRFGGTSGRPDAPANLFPAGSDPFSLGVGLASAGAAPQALPSLNQFLRGSFSLPSSTSLGTFRLSYQDALRPGVNFGDLTRPSTGLVFSTSDLGNGVFLSAGTGYGHSTAGAPAASLGNSTSGEPKHFGPSVALKLSF